MVAGTSVLVVDDDPDIIDYFSSFLDDNGYDVASAATVEAALAYLQNANQVPDVVLIDVLMPGRSGLDLMVTLRRAPQWSAIPVVIVTGNDRLLEDDCQSYVASHEGVRGPDGVLGKPVDRDTLLAVLAHVSASDGGEDD